ncbi:MAG: phosphoribosylglycinamide formyltransferase [Fimbriimonadales bacterium]
MNAERARIVLMASGVSRGSNMRAIIAATRDGRIDGDVVGAILTRPDSPAVAMLQEHGVPVTILSPKELGEQYGTRLFETLASMRPDLICLAGYMRLLPEDVVRAYPRRILNIHPALLPKYGGKGMYGARVHEAVLAAGETESGCTVHYVDEQYDHGEILLQTKVSILPEDTPESLAQRILPMEHETYPKAIVLALARLDRSSEPR